MCKHPILNRAIYYLKQSLMMIAVHIVYYLLKRYPISSTVFQQWDFNYITFQCLKVLVESCFPQALLLYHILALKLHVAYCSFLIQFCVYYPRNLVYIFIKIPKFCFVVWDYKNWNLDSFVLPEWLNICIHFVYMCLLSSY